MTHQLIKAAVTAVHVWGATADVSSPLSPNIFTMATYEKDMHSA